MTRMVAVVEEPESILKLSKLYPEDKFVFFTKGPEWARKKFDEEDAKKFSEFDIVIIQKSNQDGNALINMLAPYLKKEIIIVRYLYDGHINKDGDFQVIKANESFSFREIYHADEPWLKGYEMAVKMIEAQELESQMIESQNHKR